MEKMAAPEGYGAILVRLKAFDGPVLLALTLPLL